MAQHLMAQHLHGRYASYHHPSPGAGIRVTGAAPAARRRMALVCEGGGQRGIFTAGVLDSFMEHDYFPFALMVGASAGAQNLSAYACGARGYGREAILGYTTGKEFFDPLRFARGGHLIDLDWYFEILRREAPLDVGQGGRRLGRRALYFGATRRDTLEAAYLPFTPATAGAAIKASSAVPLFYRGGVAVDGVVMWDGGVADALPVRRAHQEGADCIVVIRTVPRGAGATAFKLPRPLHRGRLQEVAALTERHVRGYDDAVAFMARPPDSVTVVELAPSGPLASCMLGSTPQALKHDYDTGLACGRGFLDRLAGRLGSAPI
ncbi:patatin family protein [Oxalobacteraceae bacterium A2-2]